MDFFEKFRVDRSRADCRHAGAETADILFGDEGGNAELAGSLQQPDIVGRRRLGIVNRRGEFFLDIDDQQQGVFTSDQH